jgi:hypothetical protein
MEGGQMVYDSSAKVHDLTAIDMDDQIIAESGLNDPFPYGIC